MLAMTDASQTQQLIPWIGASALGFFSVAIGSQIFAARQGQPLMEIATRWSRLLAVVLGVTYLAFAMEWSLAANRSPWSFATVLLIGAILLVTIAAWFRVKGFSFEDIPLFPSYFRNEESGEWPTSADHISLREWIRKQGFRQVEFLGAYPFPETFIREYHFDSKDGRTRLCVSFIPKGIKQLCVSHAASSISADGVRYVTDNAFAPYGGLYPDNWIVDRKPLRRSVAKLLERHQRRIETSGKEFSPWIDLPLEDVKEQHRLLEKANRDNGILNPRSNWEEYGRFSQEGCYRMWKEILLLHYFGMVTR